MRCRYPSASRTVTSEPTDPFLSCASPVSMSMDSNLSTSVVDLTLASSGSPVFDVLTAARRNEHRRLFASAMRACAPARTGDHDTVSATAMTATIEALFTRILTTISHPVPARSLTPGWRRQELSHMETKPNAKTKGQLTRCIGCVLHPPRV